VLRDDGSCAYYVSEKEFSSEEALGQTASGGSKAKGHFRYGVAEVLKVEFARSTLSLTIEACRCRGMRVQRDAGKTAQGFLFTLLVPGVTVTRDIIKAVTFVYCCINGSHVCILHVGAPKDPRTLALNQTVSHTSYYVLV
jgi:hypothetical protein